MRIFRSRVLSVFLSIMMLLSVAVVLPPTVAVAEEQGFEDTFDDAEALTDINGWTYTDITNSDKRTGLVSIVNSPEGGTGKSLKLSIPAAGSLSDGAHADKNFTTVTGKTIFETRMQFDGFGDSSPRIDIYLNSDKGKTVARFLTLTDGGLRVVLTNDKNTDLLRNNPKFVLQANQWITLRMVVDPASQTWDLYVICDALKSYSDTVDFTTEYSESIDTSTGTYSIRGLPFTNASPDMSGLKSLKLKYFKENTTGSVYFDYVKLSQEFTSDTEAPTAPTLSEVSRTNNSITLSWSEATDNVGVTAYEIYNGTGKLATVDAATTSYTATGLVANTTYSFTVKARDAAGNLSEASNAIEFIHNLPNGQTYYFSASGNDANDGLSESAPKKSIGNIEALLTPGTTILLKRGDEWYDPNISWNFSNINGTENEPIVIGAYGEGEKPIVALMKKFAEGNFSETAPGSGIWVTDLTTEISLVFVDEKLWTPVSTVDDLEDKQYTVSGSKLYIKSENAPELVEVITNDSVIPIIFGNSSYITVKDITIKGGGEWRAVSGTTPTLKITLDNLTIKQLSQYGIYFTNGTDKNALHRDLLINNCYIDRVWSDAYYRATRKNLTTDGINIKNAAENYVIRGCFITNFGHTAINIGVNQTGYYGIHNGLVEDNIISGGESCYIRAFEFKGYEGTCTNNIFRRNLCYDLTNSSHFLGDSNMCYSNIFRHIVRTTAYTDTVQPYALDLEPWTENGTPYVSKNNIIANNTIIDTVTAFRANGSNVADNIFVNNLIVDWEAGTQGAGITIGNVFNPQTIKNNGFWNDNATEKVIIQGSSSYNASQANELPNMSGNIQAEPMFKNASAYDFSLTENSPYKDSGLPIADLMGEGYTDFYGKPFDLYAPSIGAIQYQREVANLISNPGYEDSATDWSPWVTGISSENVSIITGGEAYSGNSLLVSNRTSSEQGSGQNILNSLNTAGSGDYYVQAFVKASGSGTGKISIKLKEEGQSITEFETDEFELQSDRYIKIYGILPLSWNGSLAEASISFESSNTSDVYLDEWMLAKCNPIVAIEPLEGKLVLKGTSFSEIGLPATVDVTLGGNKEDKLHVQWNSEEYDPNSITTQTISGTISLPVGISNPLGLKASISVQVKNTFDIVQIEPTSEKRVFYGTPYEKVQEILPSTVTVRLEDGSYQQLGVAWQKGNYDGETAGTYILIGLVTLTDTISNSADMTAEISVIVLEESNKATELLINPGFEEGTEGWTAPWGASAGGRMEISSDAYEGENAALSVRGNRYSSPVQDITSALTAAGQGTYRVKVWLKSPDMVQENTRACIKIFDEDNLERWIYTKTITITPDGYTLLMDDVYLTWKGELKTAQFVCCETGAGYEGNVLIDGASLKSVEVLNNPGFEDGIDFWNEATWCGPLESITSPIHKVSGGYTEYAGGKAIASVERASSSRGPVQDIKQMLLTFGPGKYKFEAWARLPAGSGTNSVQAGLRWTDGNSDAMYNRAEAQSINDSGYSLVTGELNILPWDDLTSAHFVISTRVTPIPEQVYYDDFSMWYADDKAPAWIDTYPRLNSEHITSSEIAITVKTDKMSDVYWVCLPYGAAAPSSRQVKGGRNAEGVKVGDGLSGTVSISNRMLEYPITITNLAPGTDYYIYIVAEDKTAPNIQEAPVLIVGETLGQTDSEAPSAPTLSEVSRTSNSITLSWTESTDNVGVTEYEIYNGEELLAAVDAATTSYTAAGLAADTTYIFTVKAKDAAGNISEASNAVEFLYFEDQILNDLIALVGDALDSAEEGIEDGCFVTGTLETLIGNLPSLLVQAIETADDPEASAVTKAEICIALREAYELLESGRINETTGDLNQNGSITLADLGIASIHYGKNTASEDWIEAEAADFNRNGQVDIDDLIFVSKRIILKR